MTESIHDPVMLFRFALRERDWPLAGLLAGALWRDRRTRRRLERELRASAPRAGVAPPSLGALCTLGRLVRILGLERREG
jgi:hypothetical protein